MPKDKSVIAEIFNAVNVGLVRLILLLRSVVSNNSGFMHVMVILGLPRLAWFELLELLLHANTSPIVF